MALTSPAQERERDKTTGKATADVRDGPAAGPSARSDGLQPVRLLDQTVLRPVRLLDQTVWRPVRLLDRTVWRPVRLLDHTVLRPTGPLYSRFSMHLPCF